MEWTTPSVKEIAMNAEIGGYQSDFADDREPVKTAAIEARQCSTVARALPAVPIG
jgi:hypothetical protein